MLVQNHTLEQTLYQPSRFVIPVFQRFYSWQKPEWDRIWEDIVELAAIADHSRHHFMGALVFSNETSSLGKTVYRVIDGQQRLITVSILLCAMRDLAIERKLDKLSKAIEEQYLIHAHKDGVERFRIYPRQRDRAEYTAALLHTKAEDGNISNALSFFKKEISEYATTEADLSKLLDVICTRLDFVSIILSQENPFQIFRSLNSTGVELTESDLIRNYVFMNVGEHEQDSFDDEYWQPLERHFESRDPKKKGKLVGKEITAFLRDILMRSGTYVGMNNVFEDFEKHYTPDFNLHSLMQELNIQVELYDVIRGRVPHPSGNQGIDHALSLLRGLECSTAYSLVLNLLNRLNENLISDTDTIHCLKLIAGFVMRRYICNESSRGYGTWFVAACNVLADSPLENLREYLISKKYPNDAEFQHAFLKFPIYTGNYKSAILRELEMAHPNKERAPLSQDTPIEHIMPQTLTSHWRSYLGANVDEVYRVWLHTIGNLTVSKYNSELSNKSFFDKRKEYAKSGYTLTRHVSHQSVWSEQQIIERGKRLTELATKIWVGPDF